MSMRGDQEVYGSKHISFMQEDFPKEIQQLMQHDAGHIYVHLLQQQERGYDWATYPNAPGFGKSDMRFFTDSFSAMEYAHEGSPLHLDYDYNSCAKLMEALEPLVDKQLLASWGIDKQETPSPAMKPEMEDILSHDLRESRKLFEHDLQNEIADIERREVSNIQNCMAHDAPYIWQYLLAQQEKGFDYVVYPEKDTVNQEDFTSFTTHRDAVEYILEMDPAQQPLVMHSITEVNEVLAPLVEKELTDFFSGRDEERNIQQVMGQDALNIFTQLIYQEHKGNEWIVYPNVAEVRMDDVRAFTSKEKAEQFTSENSDHNYSVGSIAEMKTALEPVVQAQLDGIFHVDAPKKDQDKEMDRG